MSDRVSVILVVRNEARHLAACIRSIEAQFMPGDEWELIVVDGQSNDGSKETAEACLKEKSFKWVILDNPKKTLAPGWNTGLKYATGSLVIRPDAHSSLHDGYISRGVQILREKPEVTAVGGILLTKAKGFWGNIIRLALSSPVGVGNSSFRTNTESAYADTAVYAVYRKAIFKEVGYFDEKLVRHQDNEMHSRIHKAGGKFYLDTNMQADYYCRDTIPSLLKQMFNIGRYLPDVMFRGALSLRHLAPFAFFSSIFIMLILGISIFNPLAWIAISLLVLYLVVILAESLIKCLKNKSLNLILLLFIIPMIHLSYAAGTCWGLIELPVRKKKN